MWNIIQSAVPMAERMKELLRKIAAEYGFRLTEEEQDRIAKEAKEAEGLFRQSVQSMSRGNSPYEARSQGNYAMKDTDIADLTVTALSPKIKRGDISPRATLRRGAFVQTSSWRQPRGENGFVENAWIGHTLAIGNEVRLSITGPCGRCVMTILAQRELSKDSAILRTAVQHNQGNVGLYATVVRGGTIRAAIG
jgi:hypothetical protein